MLFQATLAICRLVPSQEAIQDILSENDNQVLTLTQTGLLVFLQKLDVFLQIKDDNMA